MAAKSELSYEKAREELTKVVEQLEAGSATLEESLKLWERGEELAKICQDWLDGAKAKLDKVKSEVDELDEDLEEAYEDEE